jgi:hypothetical protein
MSSGPGLINTIATFPDHDNWETALLRRPDLDTD